MYVYMYMYVYAYGCIKKMGIYIDMCMFYCFIEFLI